MVPRVKGEASIPSGFWPRQLIEIRVSRDIETYLHGREIGWAFDCFNICREIKCTVRQTTILKFEEEKRRSEELKMRLESG